MTPKELKEGKLYIHRWPISEYSNECFDEACIFLEKIERQFQFTFKGKVTLYCFYLIEQKIKTRLTEEEMSWAIIDL
jgi:hypothetical protein